ncbi:hypothetical protein FOMPIDRAFT_1092206, partial [Fomitopsis schrenkii]
DSPFVNFPSAADLSSFNPHTTRPCCTPDDFKWDPRIGAKSPWNKAVAQVFTADFMEKHPGLKHSQDQVLAQWIIHTTYLQKIYKEQQKSITEQVSTLQKHRRQERTYLRRHGVVTELISSTDPAAVKFIEALGVHSMSSDESDHEAGGGRATYLIREKAWRAPALVAWLRVLDSLHLYMRYNGGFLASQGGWPHYRQGSDKKSDKPAVRRLPLACYS